ncbi:D-alanyl-lipoteichoic acid acyltransferase DltB, MBOAT superfamily [Pustulibacterium marinum]|uniref:D-alanyl-lipoteichoic acid acyltransferase DltB, MBOAT superfamily n=1 Tax=Pustulibacterium marinum TaxID=1224947 RepID=A0A1I7HMQ3_9FLAO|nr:MBOAT family O-acyltransferase [Pustulibacterium marinum]SFU62005.1 D-alanyl-lipoteichoic acid acyltransferase DltB, MBOAT superfamily [Pustulibacterium marinum]
MLFNSFQFLVFLPLVFLIYWSIGQQRIKEQNVFILLASYVFYGWWDYRFLALILASTLLDFFVAQKIENTNQKEKAKRWLFVSLLFNLGLLIVFKYYNFFVDSWVQAWKVFGVTMHVSTMRIILPVGISFYTFQTLSYTIDVYRRNLKATKDFIGFAAFVTFFPQLVAGPIERATHLLPQFHNSRKFNYDKAISGVHLFIWGLLKKVVIADSCAVYVDAIFDNYEHLNAATLILGAVYFAFQIYGDFSGYSDMAIGLARLFGFDLMRNFKTPYFSRDIAEFWRRWHISLSTWFRDYLYIPLGGSRGAKIQQVRNVFIIFLVSGLWHGANWTYVFWGGLNACYFLPLLLFSKNRKNIGDLEILSSIDFIKNLGRIAVTFAFTCFAWIFFRAENLQSAFQYIKQITNFKFKVEYLSIERYSVELLLMLFIFVLVEWFYRNREEPLSGKRCLLKVSLAIVTILILGSYSNPKDFIYFQF